MCAKPTTLRAPKKRKSRASRNRTNKPQNSTPYAPALPNALGALSTQIWDLEDVKAFAIRTVDEILQKRNVQQDVLCPPNLEITIPAIEAMRYSPLRREMAALIAFTMNEQNAALAHPSFLNLLKQLTIDEMAILEAFPSTGRVLPMGDLWMRVSEEHAEILHRNIVPISIARLCATKSRLPLYVDNLFRLQLLHEPKGVKIGDTLSYKKLLRQDFCVRLLEQPKVRKHSTLEKRTIALSDAGQIFRQACLV